MNTRPSASHLASLSSVRYLAAIHLFLFHLNAMRAMGGGAPDAPPPFPAFDLAPRWVLTWVERGYCSTSLFFLLSGFVLAYLYLDEQGQSTVGSRAFWWARFTRLYPLHIVLLVLIAPLSIMFSSQLPSTTLIGLSIPRAAFLAIGFVLSATLTQSWFPEYALSWNFPTWALSTIAFFYFVFPWLARRLGRLDRRQQQWLLAGCPIVSLIPPVVYLLIVGEDRPWTFSTEHFWEQFGNEFVMRTPLFWLPHFVMGILIARLAGLTRHREVPELTTGSKSWTPSWGDLCVVALGVITTVSDATWSELLHVPASWLRLMLRHGLIAPLYMVMVRDWALGRGITARLLSWSYLARLGNASFSIFMLQLPMIVASMILFSIVPLGPFTQLVVILVLTTAVSLGCASIERRVMLRLRRR